MPESERRSLLESLIRGMAERAMGVFNRYAERALKRLLRLAGLYLAGLVTALAGVVFLAIGSVKWLAMMIPSWLAWLIVGLILLLLGVVLGLAAFLASRS